MLILIGGLAALSLAIVLVVMVTVRTEHNGVATAIATIEQTYTRDTAPVEQTTASQTGPHWLRALALRLSPSTVEARLQRQLDLAGNPAGWTPDRVLAAKGLALFAMAGVAVFLSLRMSPALLPVVTAIGGAFGFFLPDLLVYNAGVKRQTVVRGALPDALDMLTVCVESGLGFDAALAEVAGKTKGPLAAEFARVLREMQIGKSRQHALRALTERSSVNELRSFVAALVQASELGIPIAQVLREQAKEMRIRRRQLAEEKAQKVPVKIMFPLIMCILPALFVVVMGPGVMQIVETLSRR